jgi:hypothetical protein
MKKFAYIMMGKHQHMAEFDTGGKICIYMVRDALEAREKVLDLKNNGFGAIELCGAFSRDFALELISLTKGEIAIGYSVHEPEQDDIFGRFFGSK